MRPILGAIGDLRRRHLMSSTPATVQKKRLTVIMSIAKYSNALVVQMTSDSGSWPIGVATCLG